LTLVELLVVIAIIAVLLAMLLPAIDLVRARAQSAQCLSRLRGVAQAMLVYTSENDGWLPGSPSTSGRHLWTTSSAETYRSAGYAPDNVPAGAIELFDYIAPLTSLMNSPLPQTPSGIERLEAYRKLPAFACPSNDIITARAFGASVADGPMLSYCTSTAFMLLPARIPTKLNTTFAGRVTMPTGGSSTDPAHFNFWSSPPGYQPKLELVGEPSRKVFLADGARRSRNGCAPQFVYDVESDYTQTLFSDFGPFFGVTRSYDRRAANDPACGGDGRIFAYRHGTRKARRTSGSYAMNAVFFDGHAETLNDMESARPDLWLPSGSMIYRNTRLNDTDTAFWPDVWETYLSQTSQSNPHRVP